MREKVLEVCKEALPLIDFESSNKLVDDGILDSLSIVTLITELSVAFDVEFDINCITPENLNSIDDIVKTIQDLKK